MKKLLFLLLTIYSGFSFSDAVCNDGWQSTSEGSGTCSWHGGVAMWYPDGTFDDNSQDDFYFNPEGVEVSTQYGYTSAPMDLGYQSGEAAGNIINAIADAMIEGMKNENAAKANTYVPPAINNSLRNTPFYNFGTTYKSDGYLNFTGSDGIKCYAENNAQFSCNNGVNYYIGSLEVFGSDETSYQSDWKDVSNDNYYCVNSSFGSKCCGNQYSKTCSSKNNIPTNAYATSSGWRCNDGYLKILDGCKKVTKQSTYTDKEPEKSKTSNQKSSSAPKESSKSTRQFNFGSLSLSEFYQFLGGLLLLGFILWMIFSDLIKSIYNRFFNND
ncbi:MAG: hypothetical protein HN857_03005 [Gammaproteobacteria bacterium]|nr:hypothetical protein [Gammaproteobacteria bacterium]